MAGPNNAKKRAQADKKSSGNGNGSSNGSSSASRDPTQRSEPKSIPRLDGNRDPTLNGVLDYTKPTDLKNISDFLGTAGWYAARGVSTNILPSWFTHARCNLLCKHIVIPCLACKHHALAAPVSLPLEWWLKKLPSLVFALFLHIQFSTSKTSIHFLSIPCTSLPHHLFPFYSKA